MAVRILYLIGNGFDLAQGLNTRYSDFYKARILKKNLSGDILEKLQSSIKDDIQSWADMEKRLGEFSSEMGTIEDVDAVYDFLRQELRDYLKNEQERIAVSKEKVANNREILLKPEEFLPPESKDIIRTTINSESNLEIDVISFNYTDVFEKAISFEGRAFDIKPTGASSRVKMASVLKVHGALDREMIMGVADEEQIANKVLASDIDALEVMVKPRTTALRRDYVCSKCSYLIANANIIVMYGLSIGETDRNWWKLITDSLSANGNVRLIVYGHLGQSITIDDFAKISREERKIYRKLYECNGVNNLQFGRMNRQIFVSFDDRMFSGVCSVAQL